HIVQLLHKDNRLLNLPWRLAVEDREYLYITSGIREAENTALLTPKNPLPLKILVIVSSPEDLHEEARLSYEQEEMRIIQSFEPLFRHAKVQIDFTDDGSLESLKTKLKTNHYHILHFSGHGVYRNGTGYLQLEDERTLNQQLVKATEFAQAINAVEKHRPDLVLLSSCQTAQGGLQEGSFRGVSNKLLEAGVPAVVAMGFSIVDYYATEFTALLYREIAEETPLCQAFHKAIRELKNLEAQHAKSTNRLPGQWMIPQLYTSQPVENIVDWSIPWEKLEFNSVKFSTGKERVLLKSQENYLFIGRRKERKNASRALENREKVVLLRGMGGVGKTALSEHLLGRMVAHDPGVVPFVINVKEHSNFDALLNQVQEYLQNEQGQFLIYSKTAQFEKAADKLGFLLGELKKFCRPVFLFDNLESFQEAPGETFKTSHHDILELMQFMMKVKAFPLVLTSRYPIKEFPDLPEVNLNQVGTGDFYKKCLQLSFRELLKKEQASLKRLNQIQINGQEQPVTFSLLVNLLHQTLG
ncbi:MAG: CHAT domain-containing protein, partial [Bacteroidetes bacterium]|nr:CHAT domain-containing protein [Bacteroidota bacterium]